MPVPRTIFQARTEGGGGWMFLIDPPPPFISRNQDTLQNFDKQSISIENALHYNANEL